MPFLGGSCIMDAIEQSRNRICYLWKNLKLEKTRSEITGKKTFSKGEENLKNKNKWIFFFFFLPIEVFFTSLKLYHCISNEREYLNAMTTIQFQEGQNTFCRQDLFLIQHLWSEWIIMEYCFFSNGKNSNFLLESMQTTALNPQCLWKLMRFGSVRIGNVQDVWVGRMWPQTHRLLRGTMICFLGLL